MFHVREIARVVHANLVSGTDEIPRGFTHDSRLIEGGDVFVALPGKRTDGHAFLAEAFERGACGAIISDRSQAPASARNLIVVSDPLCALQALASAWRDTLTAPIVAITGSNGKTTTKALLAHLLRGDRRTHVAPHNYNTEIGVPLAVLAMPMSAEVGVFELGASAPGEVRFLADLLRPTMGLITDVGPSHLDGFGTLDDVADEKWSLVNALPPAGVALVNADSDSLLARASGERRRCLTVGLGRGAISGRIVRSVPRLTLDVDCPGLWLESRLLGSHNATNLLLAAASAHVLGVSETTLEDRTRSFSPPPHRLQPFTASFGTLLDDTYNSNPSSAAASLRVLAEFGDKSTHRAFVFGDMLDLGSNSASYHRNTVELALNLGIDVIFPVGERTMAACQSIERAVFTRPSERASRIRGLLSETDNVVLVKGSRALALEHLVGQLLEGPEQEP